MKTVDYLDAVKAAYSLGSDYQLAKKLGEGSSRISQYRVGRTFMDDDLAVKIAYLLDLNPLKVLADAHIEREERNGRTTMVNFWQEVRRSGRMNHDNLSNVV